MNGQPQADGQRPLPDAPSSADFEFRHFLRDTIILLGGKKEIADLLTKSEDFAVSEADVEELRRYNIALLEGTKDRLANIHRLKIRTKSE